MRFATIEDGTRDGRLHLVSRDNSLCAPSRNAVNLQGALEEWDAMEPKLRIEYDLLNAGDGIPFDPSRALAPLPRAWQWLDGSAYDSHVELMQTAFNLAPIDNGGRPLMYQGLSDRFYSSVANVRLPSEDDGIDFEGEFGIILDAVQMGTNAVQAREHIRIIVQINDWSLRGLGAVEMKTGFGWISAKPACSMAPVAVTPDELGPYWRDARVDLALALDWNGARFGAANGYSMSAGFDELIAHAAYSRDLVAGTVLGSGTVSNVNFREIGSSCIAERRAIEILDFGTPKTEFMKFGDRIRMEATLPDGTPLFGAIDQQVVRG
ncbi:fumarylacetoacetate hydrolase family protein [Bradyrhizobium sp. 45]|uniref:fumarylacetoacetate hydrolase family protein n=1 Tax=Bradyrhizobium sp. 45 TaxID=1043587 RepID=UPI001FF91803|nr:fumarylacetoacetate hydrolase family protein [Bradyrhizobium sp. 45]MCK1305793.1 fumarylacetoacetate hydrolase family protein [Bradyrhizobium sp. 45]